MDTLREILQALRPHEEAEFSSYLLRTGRVNSRKDLALMKTLRHDAGKKGRETALLFYSDNNLNAYHSLRKRLARHLEHFILLKRLDNDSTMASGVMGCLSMSRFMLERNAHAVAKQYLHKAEHLAEKTGQWDLLDNVYNEQIRFAHHLEIDLPATVVKWKQNKQRASSHERLLLAHSTIRYKLSEARNAGRRLDLQEITRVALREFALEREARNNAGFMHTIMSMVRSAVISTKDYYRFEPYVTRAFQHLEKSGAFLKTDMQLQLDFYYMIAHSKYRNRKFSEADDFLIRMETILEKKRNPLFDSYFPKYVLLRAAVFSYRGENLKAAQLLEQALKDKSIQLETSARMNMLVNLCVYLFQSEKYRAANKILYSIEHSDRWLEKKMGKEWRFKKNLIEIIVQFELGNFDIALSRIRQLEKYFSLFLKQPFYQRAWIFTSFIKTLINEPGEVHTLQFAQRVEQAGLALPGDREDIQAITFFCWLKSKMLKRKYYEVLIETIDAMQ